MEYLTWIIAATSSLLLILSSIAFLKAKTTLTMLKITTIVNCYIITLILITIVLKEPSLTSTIKILIIITLNIIITNSLCQKISKSQPSAGSSL